MWRDADRLKKTIQEQPWSRECQIDDAFLTQMSEWIRDRLFPDFLGEMSRQVDSIVEIDVGLPEPELLARATRYIVEFLGAVQGDQKWVLLRRAQVFCLPSPSEVIGMVNLEAAACRTPVITTQATGLPGAWAEAGGVLAQPSVPSLEQALSQAVHWTSQERLARGEGLHNLIETTYSWKATSPQWIELYQRLAGAP